LLILDLHPPHGQPGQLLSGLLQQWPTYLAYAASYLYVAVVWLNHKAAFARIRVMDRGLHWANLGVLATTALLPFPTSVVAGAIENGNRTDARVAVALYALIGALLCASWWLFFHYLARHPRRRGSSVASHRVVPDYVDPTARVRQPARSRPLAQCDRRVGQPRAGR
jgi:uncharacterized membrane protein